MNEELINQIVSRILSEPAFQALLQGNNEEKLENKGLKPDGIVLLNYVPDFERVLNALKISYGADYTLSILPSEQAGVSKPTLPEGMNLSLIHISEPTRLGMISYAVFCLKKKK